MKINIAYSCNDYYIPQTGISLISVLENNKSINEIVVYIVSKDISRSNMDILRNICLTYNRKLIEVPYVEIAFDLKLSDTGRHIETIYSKIFFSRIEGLSKCLYIDSDTIIVESLEALWNTDLSNKYLGAVETFTSRKKKVLNMSKESVFFNDGITLMNVDYCRENNLIGKSLDLIKTFQGNPPVLSEGILNAICKDHMEIISMRFNLMSGMLQLGLENPKYLSSITSYSVQDIEESCNNPVVIHYLSGYYNRPWSTYCTHPYKKEYLKYKAISPWKHQELTKNKLPQRINRLKQIGNIIGYVNLLGLSNVKYWFTELIKN